MAAELGVTISGPAFSDWFSDQSVACLAHVLEAAIAQVVAADPVAIPLLARFPAVVLQDSTVISLPPDLAAQCAGCGGSQGATAALKAQLRLEMCTGRVDGPLLQAGRASDRAVAFRARPPVGSLTIRDLGYFQLDDMRHDQRDGRHWLCRLKPQTAVFLPDGTRLNLFAWLNAQGTTQVDQAVHMGVAQHLPVRLLAVRVPAQVAEQRRRRLQQDARKKGRTVRAETLAACDWTLIVTTVPVDQLSLTEALVLLKLRWQIELLFKLWKDHGHLDESRGRRPVRVLTEVYAKFIAMIIQHWLLLTGCWAAPDRSLPNAAAVYNGPNNLALAQVDIGGESPEAITLLPGTGEQMERAWSEPSALRPTSAGGARCSLPPLPSDAPRVFLPGRHSASDVLLSFARFARWSLPRQPASRIPSCPPRSVHAGGRQAVLRVALAGVWLWCGVGELPSCIAPPPGRPDSRSSRT